MKRYFKNILLFACISLLALSCKKKEYLTDSGVHSVSTPLSNYDYLKQNSWKLFDTLLMVVDHFNIKEEMNNANTFFAPTNYSINRFMLARLAEKQATSSKAAYTLDSLYKYITADSVRQYMFADKITFPDVEEDQTRLYTSLGKTSMGVYKELQRANQFTQYTNNPTYLFYLVKVRAGLDVPGVAPPTGEEDTRVLSQTTGILTSGGTKVLHALSNAHVFVRF